MPMEYIYLDDGGVIVKGVGVLKGSELIEGNREMYSTDAKVLAIKYLLADFTEIESAEISFPEVRVLANIDKKVGIKNSKLLWAIVASEDLMFGLARVWSVYVSEVPGEKQIFRSLDEAKAWVKEELSAE